MLACGTPDAVDRYRQAKQAAARAVLEAKTRVWEEFGEAMEEDYQGQPRRDSGKPLCNIAWRLGTVPLEWQTGVVVPLFKKGGPESVFQLQRDHTSQPPRKVYARWTNSIPSHEVLEGLWEFAQPVHMCFVDLEKAFDRVPRGILWGVLCEYGVRGPLLRAVRSLYDPEQELGSHCHGRAGGVRFGNHRISSLLFADDVVLLASSQDLQHVLGGLQPSVKRLG
ncbi:hypothetical protein L3Q82_016903 [Scortum barcoo]|uniref:Uncharacterized protein n=1 Tax=Scortum barcoo TaxID=214431 RepID=A0ACB8X822_9TELE|nr:hypothetical protein L3Q82_016903 [Scortum barcoo]